MFIDREAELASLEKAYSSQQAEFLVVYGRRRVGKTALLRAFCTDRPSTYWMASLSSEAILRQSFTDTLWQTTHPDSHEAGFVYASWERAFLALADLAARERHIAVIDEFPYLVAAEPAIPSLLQKVWDERLQNTHLMLILCGSQMGMMEREVLEYRSPLYGRRSGQILLRPLPLQAASAFFPRYSASQQIEAYAILGGIPAYLGQFDDHESLVGNIEQRILNANSYLYLEPQFLLREELQEPRNYFAILQAVAQGRTRLGEIIQATGIERGPASRYLAILQDLHLVERRVPVTETQPAKSRRGIYRLCDPFLAFWFRFVTPYASVLERGYTAPVVQTITAGLSQFIGPVFEDLCRDWVMAEAAKGHLPFLPHRIGAWWDGQEEIDLVAIGQEAILLGECKWSSHPVGLSVLDDLKRQAYPLMQRGRWGTVYYALFSRSGFTPELDALARTESLILVSPEQLLAS